MPDRFKIAYLGAGSFRFSSGLFLDLCKRRDPPNDLSPMEIGLCDIDENSLRIMEKLFHQIVKKAQKINTIDIKITSSTNREDILENADHSVHKRVPLKYLQSLNSFVDSI